MPNIEISTLIPSFPYHWTSILHYLLLLGALFMLMTSGDKTPIVFILVLAVLALLIGADLYIDKLPGMPRFFVYLGRVAILGLPLLLSGLSTTEHNRVVGVVMAGAAVPLLALTFLNCIVPLFLADPRIYWWCSLAPG